MRGRVEDQSAARIASAMVEAKLVATGRTRRVLSDAHGAFILEDLAPGSWHLVVNATGFAIATGQDLLGLPLPAELTPRDKAVRRK